MVRELHQQHVQAGYKKVHWEEVRRIIEKALVPEFAPRLVSYSDETRVIQESIVKNVALDPIVVCDVSAMNPNVMFELGMRLAFDMPTVVIKDSSTTYSFDTGPIEHVPYPAGPEVRGCRRISGELAKEG